MTTPLVAARSVTFSHGSGAFELRVPELTLQAGEKVACIGPSGSGKTTLVHLLAGILAPTGGSIRVGDRELTALSEAERRRFRLAHIGLVFQDFALLASLTVAENVTLPFRIGVPDRDRAHRGPELLEAAGLSSLARRRPEQLSRGELQRVALCRALVTEPMLVLGDEPTGNLDPDNAQRVMDLLFREVDRIRGTLFLVTHDHGVLHRFDRVIDVTALGGRS